MLYGELDGTFPNHPADPIQPENLKDLERAVLDLGADVGLAFDGDADRVFLVDDAGQPVSGSTTTAIVAAGILDRHPGETVVHNLICSRAVPEVIREHGGIPVRTRVGHSFIKQVMAETGAIFGGEHSAHYYFRDNWRADSGSIAALLRARATLPRRRAALGAAQAVRALRAERRDQLARRRPRRGHRAGRGASTRRPTQDRLDGLTVDAGEWWFNLRPSNTEPLLRLNLEAPDAASCEAAHRRGARARAQRPERRRRLTSRPGRRLPTGVPRPSRRSARGRGLSGRRVPRRARVASAAASSASTSSSSSRATSSPASCSTTSRRGAASASAQFYARRARRVLPAALVTLVITAIVYARVATPVERLDALGGFRAAVRVRRQLVLRAPVDRLLRAERRDEPGAALLVARGGGAVLPPVAARARRTVVRDEAGRAAAVVGGAVVGRARRGGRRPRAALHLGASNLERAYYGTDTRVYELLAGAVIALTPRLLTQCAARPAGSRASGAGAAIAGIVLLASSAIGMSPITAASGPRCARAR